MNEGQTYIDIETYEHVAGLHKRERNLAWFFAIGLQDGDGFRVSD